MANTQPTTKTVPIYGAIARFAPEGRTIETVTVAADAKPAGAVFMDWESIPCLEEATIGHETVTQGTVVTCFNPTTGRREKKKTETTDADVKVFYEFTIQEVTPFIHQITQAAASVGAGDGAFVPGSQGGGAFQGWLHIQQQQGTELVQVSSLWGELTLNENAKVDGETGHKPKLRFMQLGNALDAGVLGTNS